MIENRLRRNDETPACTPRLASENAFHASAPRKWAPSSMHNACRTRYGRFGRRWVAALLAVMALASSSSPSRAGENPTAAKYRDEIEPVLVDYCYACHGDGLKKGNVAFDAFASEEAMLKDRDLWWGVLKNVRAGIMPPAGKPR